MLTLELAKHIREEGDKKLFLLIAFDLPFNEIADVHHCRDKKGIRSQMTKGKNDKRKRKYYRIISDVNSCRV